MQPNNNQDPRRGPPYHQSSNQYNAFNQNTHTQNYSSNFQSFGQPGNLDPKFQ